MDKEKQIEKLIKSLDISREEALQLINDDAKVDKMTSSKDINADLTAEQQTALKNARKSDRKPTVYKFDTKRKKADNPTKKELINAFAETVNDLGGSYEIINEEREFKFTYLDTTYKIVLSVPRS